MRLPERPKLQAVAHYNTLDDDPSGPRWGISTAWLLRTLRGGLDGFFAGENWRLPLDPDFAVVKCNARGRRMLTRLCALCTPTRVHSAHGQRSCLYLNRRNRRLLLTTNTLENAIAAPASIGLRRPAAASGIAAAL